MQLSFRLFHSFFLLEILSYDLSVTVLLLFFKRNDLFRSRCLVASFFPLLHRPVFSLSLATRLVFVFTCMSQTRFILIYELPCYLRCYNLCVASY